MARSFLLILLIACSGRIGDPANGPEPYGPDPDGERELTPGREFLCEGEGIPGPSLVRRLTTAEYVQTVRASVGVDVADVAPARIPPEPPADGFSNTAATLVVSLPHVEAYEALATIIVERIDDFGLFVDRWTTCRDATRCEEDYITNLGTRLYRAPITNDERDALLPLFAAARAEGLDFDGGAELVLRAMLQSPRFLYRTEAELGQERALDGYELASRLSYLVWGAPPDDALFDAAAADALRTDAQVMAQIDRMLEDPRARGAARTFAREWLGLARLDFLTRDEERFPDWTPEIGQAMQEETLAFVEHVLFDQSRPLADLFDAQVTVLTPELATHYGLPEPAADGTVDLSAIPERGGLLTQGSVLTVGGNESSMVMRGLYLLDRVLCLELGSPPEGVDTTPPEIEPGRSQRYYSEQRVENPACAGCHAQMEPLAWGLEQFDATGLHHVEDEFGNALQQSGQVRFDPYAEPSSYGSSQELMGLLAESERVRDCISLKAAQYGMGRRLLETDGCALADLRSQLEGSGGTYRDLLVAIATSPMFRNLRSEEAP